MQIEHGTVRLTDNRRMAHVTINGNEIGVREWFIEKDGALAFIGSRFENYETHSEAISTRSDLIQFYKSQYFVEAA